MANLTLVEAVNNILSSMDSLLVNTTEDTIESKQVKEILRDVWYEMQAVRNIGACEETVFNEATTGKYESLNEVTLVIPTAVTRVQSVWFVNRPYEFNSSRELPYVHESDFLTRQFRLETSDDVVNTFNIDDIALPVYNHKMPSMYTIFKERYIVFDSYWADPTDFDGYVGTIPSMFCHIKHIKEPSFPLLDTDTFTPFNGKLQTLLLLTAKDRAFEIIKGLRSATIADTVKKTNRFLAQEQRVSLDGVPRLPNFGRRSKKGR